MNATIKLSVFDSLTPLHKYEMLLLELKRKFDEIGVNSEDVSICSLSSLEDACSTQKWLIPLFNDAFEKIVDYGYEHAIIEYNQEEDEYIAVMSDEDFRLFTYFLNQYR